jgi:hypothetical protein
MKMSMLNRMAVRGVAGTLAPGSTVRLLVFLIAGLGLIGPAAGESAPAQSGSSSAAPTQSYEGMLTDTRCGAKHSAAIGKAAADCARVCVHGGERFALVDGDNVYVLEGDLEPLKRMAGQRVRIVGSLNGNTIAVSSVVGDK